LQFSSLNLALLGPIALQRLKCLAKTALIRTACVRAPAVTDASTIRQDAGRNAKLEYASETQKF
jgi:hypothetical protein